jgi:hypothetical protein
MDELFYGRIPICFLVETPALQRYLQALFYDPDILLVKFKLFDKFELLIRGIRFSNFVDSVLVGNTRQRRAGRVEVKTTVLQLGRFWYED